MKIETVDDLDVGAAVLEHETRETMDLVRWFVGRYPIAKDRFAYIRRKYAEWRRNPPARVPPVWKIVSPRDPDAGGGH